MAKLPGWMKTIKTDREDAMFVIAIRWWHPHVWGICYQQCKKEILESGHNPNHIAMRWLIVKTVVHIVWEQSKRSWKF